MSVYARISFPVTALPTGTLLSAHSGTRVELERIVPADRVTAYLWIVGEDRAGMVRDLRADPSDVSVETVDEVAGRTLVRITDAAGGSSLLDVVGETDVGIVDATGTNEGWLVDVRAPDGDALDSFYGACRSRDIAIELRGINEFGFASRDADYGLSEIQRETIVTALDAGYFDVPRRTTLAKLAAEMGVSEQAVSERLRRGLSRFLTTTIGDLESE